MKNNLTTSPTHLDSLDGLRAVAALLVLFTHGLSAHLWSGYSVGSIGVAIFFCLSGFLMGYLYLQKQPTPVSIRNYLVSRFSRIAPSYLFTIIVAFIIYSYIDSGFVYKIGLHNLTRHLLFSGNVSIFWSIPPEVQFYVFFIFVWFAIANYKYANYILLVLLVMSILLMLYFRNDVPGTTLPSKIHFFMLGAFSGLLRRKISNIQSHYLEAMQVFLFITLILYGAYLVNLYDFKYPYAILHYSLFTAITVFLLSYQTRFTNIFLANNFLMAIGKWSFSLYLSHEAVIYYVKNYLNNLPQILMALITIVSALTLSWLMYSIIEIPSQTVLKRFLVKKS